MYDYKAKNVLCDTIVSTLTWFLYVPKVGKRLMKIMKSKHGVKQLNVVLVASFLETVLNKEVVGGFELDVLEYMMRDK